MGPNGEDPPTAVSNICSCTTISKTPPPGYMVEGFQKNDTFYHDHHYIDDQDLLQAESRQRRPLRRRRLGHRGRPQVETRMRMMMVVDGNNNDDDEDDDG